MRPNIRTKVGKARTLRRLSCNISDRVGLWMSPNHARSISVRRLRFACMFGASAHLAMIVLISYYLGTQTHGSG